MACPCALCIRHRERPQSKLLPYATLLRSCWLTCLSNSSWGHLPFPTTAAPHHRVLISHHPGWPLHPGVPSTVQEFLGFSTEKYNFLGQFSVSGKSNWLLSLLQPSQILCEWCSKCTQFSHPTPTRRPGHCPGTCQKCKFLSSSPDPLKQKLGES